MDSSNFKSFVLFQRVVAGGGLRVLAINTDVSTTRQASYFNVTVQLINKSIKRNILRRLLGVSFRYG